MTKVIRALLAAIASLAIVVGVAAPALASETSTFCTARTANDTMGHIYYTYYVDGGGAVRVRLDRSIASSTFTVGKGIDYEMSIGSDDGIAWGINGKTPDGVNSKTADPPSGANARLLRNGVDNHPYVIIRAGANGDGYAMCQMRWNM